MLVLSRNHGQSIIINDNITITVLGVTGNQVRLGIDAPKDVSINREEVQERVQASRSDPSDKVCPKCQTPLKNNIKCPACSSSAVSDEERDALGT